METSELPQIKESFKLQTLKIMTNELGRVIIEWHVEQVCENFELEDDSSSPLFNDFGDLQDLPKLIKQYSLPEDAEVLLKIDYCASNQDNEREQAMTLIKNYDAEKDLYCIKVIFEDDDCRNEQYYKLLIQ